MGKTGNLTVNFSRQGKHRELSKFYFLHRENCANMGKFLKIKNFLIFSTAESGQLCYTNRCGVVVVGVVIVVGGMVNFLNFDLTIGCLPLI